MLFLTLHPYGKPQSPLLTSQSAMLECYGGLSHHGASTNWQQEIAREEFMAPTRCLLQIAVFRLKFSHYYT